MPLNLRTGQEPSNSSAHQRAGRTIESVLSWAPSLFIPELLRIGGFVVANHETFGDGLVQKAKKNYVFEFCLGRMQAGNERVASLFPCLLERRPISALPCHC